MGRPSPRRLTRLDRERAVQAAASMDIGPAVRVLVVLAVVGLFVYAVGLFAPSSGSFGGPLQGPLAGRASFTSIRKTGGGSVTLALPVPWNAGSGLAVIGGIAPIEPSGVEVGRSGVLPPGNVALGSQRGFPPPSVVLSPLAGYTAAPGAGDLDGFQVVVELRGDGTVGGFALPYRVGDRSYVAILPGGALLCSAKCVGKAEAEQAQRELTTRLAAFVDVAPR